MTLLHILLIIQACVFQKATVQDSSKKRKLKFLLSDTEKFEKELTTVPDNKDNKTNETKLKRRKLKNIRRNSLIKLLSDERKINDSSEVAKELFQWMISPIPLNTFFK